MTIDVWMLRRLYFQAEFRLRLLLFLKRQKIELVILEDILATFPPSNANNPQLAQVHRTMMSTVINQGAHIGEIYYRSRLQKIDSFFEVSFYDRTVIGRDLKIEDLERVDPYKSVLELPQDDNTYDQAGAIEYPVSSVKDLTQYGARRLDLFRNAKGNEEEVAAIEGKITQAIAKAARSPRLAEKVKSPGAKELGMQANVFLDINQNTHKDVNQDINKELLKQLEQYEQVPYNALRNEERWEDATIEALLISFSEGTPFTPTAEMMQKGKFQPISLPTLFTKELYKEDAKEYSGLFSDQILVTHAWAFASTQHLPLFHRLQRSADFLLFAKLKTGYRVLIVSQQEAASFKSYLHRHCNEERFR